MKWIDQTAYTCARNWAETYYVTVYVGGICFLKRISIGKVIKINALWSTPEILVFMERSMLIPEISVRIWEKNVLGDCFGRWKRETNTA